MRGIVVKSKIVSRTSSIADIVSAKIKIALQGHARPIFGRAVPQKDFNFQLQQLWRNINRLRQESEESDKIWEDNLNVYLKAEQTVGKKIVDKKTGKNLRRILSEKFGTLEKRAEEAEQAKKLYTQAKSYFGDNKAAIKVLKEAKKLAVELAHKYSKAEKTVDTIAKKNYPGKLDEKVDPFIEELLKKFKRELKAASKSTGLKVHFGKKDYLSIDEGKGGRLRFSRFIELVNIPRMDKGKFKTFFLVLTTDLVLPKRVKGRFVGNFSDIYIAFTPSRVRPRSLPKSLSIKTRADIKKVMSIVCHNNNIALFGNVVEVDVGDRLEDFREVVGKEKKAEKKAEKHLKKIRERIEEDLDKKHVELEKRQEKRKKAFEESGPRVEKNIKELDKKVAKDEKELRPLKVQFGILQKKLEQLERENERNRTNKILPPEDIKSINILYDKISKLEKDINENKRTKVFYRKELEELPEHLEDLEVELDVQLEREEKKLLEDAKKDFKEIEKKFGLTKKSKVKILVDPRVRVKSKGKKIMVTMPESMVTTKEASLEFRTKLLERRLKDIEKEAIGPKLRKQFEDKHIDKKEAIEETIKERYEEYKDARRTKEQLRKKKKSLKEELKEKLEVLEDGKKVAFEEFLEDEGVDVEKLTSRIEGQKKRLEKDLEILKRQKREDFVDPAWLEDLYAETMRVANLPIEKRKKTAGRLPYTIKRRKDGKIRFTFTVLPATKAEELPELGKRPGQVKEYISPAEFDEFLETPGL